MIAILRKSALLVVCVCVVGTFAFAQSSSSGVETDGEEGSFKKELMGGKDDDKAPLFIKSDSLQLESEKGLFTYKGNVEVRRGELLITSDVMVGHFEKDNRIDNIVCDKNVVITQGDSLWAAADHADYDVENSIIELTEGPEFIHHGNALTADKVIVYLDEDRSKAEGDVRVKVIKTEDSETQSITSMMKGEKKKTSQAQQNDSEQKADK